MSISFFYSGQNIKDYPNTCIFQLAKEHNLGQSTMAQLVKEDLRMISRAVVTKNFITPRQKITRLDRCQQLLNWIKNHCGLVRVFTDEKLFTYDQVVNRRNTLSKRCLQC